MRRASEVQESAGTWNAADGRSTASCSTPTSGHRRRDHAAERASAAPSFLLDLPQRDARCATATGWCSRTARSCAWPASPSRSPRSRAASPHELARLAWHLGNRHTDVQVVGERLRIRRDHVLEEMLRGLGARADADRGAVRSGAAAPITAASSRGTADVYERHRAPLEAGRALPADGVAVAGLSGRRLLLFQRDRMGGRGRRHRRRDDRSSAGSP